MWTHINFFDILYLSKAVKLLNRIKELRLGKELRQVELAQIIGMSQSSLSGYESGKIEPDQETLIRLSEFFDVSIDYLLGISNVKKAPTLEQVDAKELQRLKELVERLTPEQQEELLRYGQYLAAQPPFSKDS